MQREINIINLRQLLDETKLVTTTIRIILSTNLLKQFQTTILLKMSKTLF